MHVCLQFILCELLNIHVCTHCTVVHNGIHYDMYIVVDVIEHLQYSYPLNTAPAKCPPDLIRITHGLLESVRLAKDRERSDRVMVERESCTINNVM